MKKQTVDSNVAHSAKKRQLLASTHKKKKHNLNPREYWRMRWNNAKTDEKKIEVWTERNNRVKATFPKAKFANGNAVFNGGFTPINEQARKGMGR